MARYDVYRLSGSRTLLLDVQSNLLADLPTRVVIPLRPDAPTTPKINRLHATVEVGGKP